MLLSAAIHKLYVLLTAAICAADSCYMCAAGWLINALMQRVLYLANDSMLRD